MKKIILIDGNSLMFRSYYATAFAGTSNLMKNKEGTYTNALFGFCNMLSKIITDTTDYAFVAFDAGKKTFRHQQYDDYKGGRKPLPDELRMQIPLIKEYLDIIKVKRLESLDYEADDLIATVCEKYKNEFKEVLIITGDKDLLQLVDGNVTVGLTKKGITELDLYTESNFYEKMGFFPNQVVEYKGICGDTSDNLPGVKGIGDKTTIKLLSEYKTIEGILEHLDKLTPKVKTLFTENKEIALKCRYLATLERNADINISLSDLEKGEVDYNELMNFFKKMDFTSFLKKLTSKQIAPTTTTNEITLSNDFSKLSGTGFITMEVFGKNYFKDPCLGFGLINQGNKYFITLEDLNNIDVRRYLESESDLKITFDCKAIYTVLNKHNVKFSGVVFDMLIASYLINPQYASEDFKKVADNFSDNSIAYYDNIYGANSKMTVPSFEVYSSYSISKCEYLLNNYEDILKEVKANNLDYLCNVETKLSRVLADMEYDGLKIDLNRLDTIGENLQQKVEICENQIYALAGEVFNINSVKKLGEVLFEKLGLPHGKKNKTGYSTNQEVLEKLAVNFEIARLILEYRGLTKLISTYVNGLKEVTMNSYIHPLYKQALTNTGRLSSVEPNIQNMPIRTEVGQVIREVFVSRFEEGQIISADYSQIELRVLAHMSDDEKMINAFNSGIDFHTQTASEIYEVDIDNVTKEMRRNAKAINFGIIYGMSAWGLSEQLNISPLEANIYINKYFSKYNNAKKCLDEFISKAVELGYSQTLYGRKRYINELYSTNFNLKSFGERTAMNSPIQGTAADIIKIAMINVYEKMKERNLESKLIAQVHDELVFDCPKYEVSIMKELVANAMSEAVSLRVKLVASVASGDNWFSAK